MTDHLAAAAQALGMPEAIVKRSAEARAKSTGSSVEDILEAWASGAEAPAGGAPAAGPATAGPPAAAPEPTPPPVEPAPAAPPVEGTAPDVPARPAAAGTVTPLPGPETVTPEEALGFPVVVSVPTAGLSERTETSIPRWLSAIFVLVPLFGVLYLAGGVGDAGACQEGGFQLAVDRMSGEVRNCDGTEFTGRGGAGGGAEAAIIALGEETYANCTACHGPAGAGSGAFPALTGVIQTFGSCADHIEWVDLGSAGFQAAGNSTFGDTGKTINGGMPPFGGSLSAEQLAAVVAFERVRFGGGDQATVLADCGLVEAEAPAEGEAPADGEAPTGTTVTTTAGA